MTTITEQIKNIGIVPVVKLDDAKDAIPLAKALIEGGLPCAEVTFRTDAAYESIRLIAETYPEMLVGAGTVLTTEQVDASIEAGAKFIVSPGLNPKIVKYCIEKNIPIFPGCANASDIEQAIECGLEVVKFFPAEVNGGLDAINALSGPYPNMKFMPTGGVNLKNMMRYLSSDKIIACGGTWMVSDALIKSGNYDEIVRISQEAVNQMIDLRLDGMESSNDAVLSILDIERTSHYVVSTTHLSRAMYNLASKGYEFTTPKMESGHMSSEIVGKNIKLIER
ncbi:bifunctional 4-hydroxy-2-oxoglutarate aldolase/2-dehydro-3-deoxy-phosphogluconate aldolase [Erysipelothrix sp. HDW6C]|uniref:bifunctional 4-hydroxy-2-oxoglutarate aldolase/2-dehydro-3-deoxy-phosphogluconate aldolase n=1 Tax=Erysipelothrix sp. HDW6C TaxID=2714930 RepID=UPI00140766E5|nr:bifunctional 4-hydroxy-2-oxoglutarate aldolase/2-dehydro-3-deoxy-phosphogluconate aldolase [Erysipelothrix sp. HDW6C]QIK69297.1 bifunctional 4-hydroxy-2-oxoglutarate aldolase/2-dehydro-3-deoxy-phosphogluconate aldolase [Erysipelothrix sp. HDW6C]